MTEILVTKMRNGVRRNATGIEHQRHGASAAKDFVDGSIGLIVTVATAEGET